MPELKDLLKTVQKSNDSIESIVADAKNNKYIAPIIKEFDLSDDEIVRYYPIIASFAEDKEAEKRCPGVNDCSLPTPHFISSLKMEDGVLIREVHYCPCYQRIIDRKKGYVVKDFDPALFKATVGEIKRLNTGKTVLNNLGLAHKDNTKKWLFINDTDHIADKYVVPYLNWCSEKGMKVAFVDYPKYVERIKNLPRFQVENFNAEMNLLENVDVLVLNNFGSEYKSEYCRDTILMPILRARGIKKAETVLISAYDRSDIKDLYSGNSVSGRVTVKELDNILNSNLYKDIAIKAGIEEQF